MADQGLDDLIAELGALRSRLGGLDGRLDDQERAIQELAAEMARRAQADAEAPWWWPTMTQNQATEAWQTLTDWVDRLIIPRYDDGENTSPMPGSRVLRPEDIGLPHSSRVLRCWFAHPGVVDKLSALYWAQKGDYRPNAVVNGPLEWQENWLPKTLDSLDSEFKTKKCIGGCPHLNGMISGEWPTVKHNLLNLRDRTEWIKADIGRRPK